MAFLERTKDTFRDEDVPVLRTDRLVLRPPRLADARRVAALCSDRRIAENTARIPHPYALSDAHAWIDAVNQAPGDTTFLIEIGGEAIGCCGVDLRAGLPEIGYWLGVPFWGHGYATEAAQAVIDYAFTERRLPELHSGARVTNPASRRVLEKLGFLWTGVALCRVRALGTSVPIDRFRLERTVWTLRKSASADEAGDDSATPRGHGR
jgi:RimJ/RimL family protein N-acetyltransferase